MADRSRTTSEILEILESTPPLLWWWNAKAFLKQWGMPGDWLLPRISRGSASWCGRYLIIHAPRNVSLVMGRGTQGLELYRWLEHG